MNQSFLKDAPLKEIEDFKKWILHEDENLLVIDKPGCTGHPSKNGPFKSGGNCEVKQLTTQTCGGIRLASR